MTMGRMARSEMCVVDPDELDIPDADRQTLDAMQSRMKKFSEAMATSFGAGPTMDFDAFGGIPVYMNHHGEGAGEVLDGVSHSGIDAELLRIPAGYRQETLGAGN